MGQLLKVRDIGYRSYRKAKKIDKLLKRQMYEYHEFLGEMRTKKDWKTSALSDVRSMILEIEEEYKGNVKVNGLIMYKYQETLDEVYRTLKKLEEQNLIDEPCLQEKIRKVVSYVYKDMKENKEKEKERDKEEVMRGIEVELVIVKELDRLRKERNNKEVNISI